MKIYIVNIMMLVYSTRIGLKRRNTKANLIEKNPRVFIKYLNRNIWYNSSSYTTAELNHTFSKYKIQDNVNNKELFKFLDHLDVSEPSIEELNKCAPVTFDYDSLNDLLEDKQNSKLTNDQLVKINNEIESFCDDEFINDQEYINIQSDLKKDINNIDKNNNIPLASSLIDYKDHLNTQFHLLKKERPMWTILRIYIKDYILKHISVTYRNKYLRRMDDIDEACDIFDDHILYFKKYPSIFNPIQDEKIVCEIEKMFLSFDKSSEFNQETCFKFLKEFNMKIFSNSDLFKIRGKLVILTYGQKNRVFNNEFIKFYKYVGEIPELLILGSLYKAKSCCNIIIIIHLINIFAENVEDYRFFILCMISKALQCFYRNQLDIFLISDFQIECRHYKHNLYYFVWEFNSKKRYDTQCRKNNGFNWRSNDINYLRTIFLLYLYQIKILDKYYKINADNIKLLQEFIDKVKDSKDCVGCFLNEYLEILPKIKLNSF